MNQSRLFSRKEGMGHLTTMEHTVYTRPRSKLLSNTNSSPWFKICAIAATCIELELVSSDFR